MAAGVHDIVIDQGARWSLSVTWQDAAGDPVNITGFAIAGQVRTAYADEGGELLAEMEATITDAEEGSFELAISTEDTGGMPSGSWRWDVELGPVGGEVERLLMGRALVRSEVTRESS